MSTKLSHSALGACGPVDVQLQIEEDDANLFIRSNITNLHVEKAVIIQLYIDSYNDTLNNKNNLKNSKTFLIEPSQGVRHTLIAQYKKNDLSAHERQSIENLVYDHNNYQGNYSVLTSTCLFEQRFEDKIILHNTQLEYYIEKSHNLKDWAPYKHIYSKSAQLIDFSSLKYLDYTKNYALSKKAFFRIAGKCKTDNDCTDSNIDLNLSSQEYIKTAKENTYNNHLLFGVPPSAHSYDNTPPTITLVDSSTGEKRTHSIKVQTSEKVSFRVLKTKSHLGQKIDFIKEDVVHFDIYSHPWFEEFYTDSIHICPNQESGIYKYTIQAVDLFGNESNVIEIDFELNKDLPIIDLESLGTGNSVTKLPEIFDLDCFLKDNFYSQELEWKKLQSLYSNYISADNLNVFEIYNKDANSTWSEHSTLIDFTGVAWDAHKAGTLITNQHVVFASHFQRSVNEELSFHDKSGKIYKRYIDSKKTINHIGEYKPDITVAKLNEPLPNSIKTYPLLAPSASRSSLNKLRFHPYFVTDQNRRSHVHKLSPAYGENDEYIYGRSSFDKLPDFFTKKLIVNDSGHPSFIQLQGIDILISTHSFEGYGHGPDFSDRQNVENIIKAIFELD